MVDARLVTYLLILVSSELAGANTDLHKQLYKSNGSANIVLSSSSSRSNGSSCTSGSGLLEDFVWIVDVGEDGLSLMQVGGRSSEEDELE